jgi:hypothetical protein
MQWDYSDHENTNNRSEAAKQAAERATYVIPPGRTEKVQVEDPFGPALSRNPFLFLVENTRLQINLQGTMVIGRVDPLVDEQPDLDLTPYEAEGWGVSRHHARIERRGKTLHIIDLNSTNGTYVNGRRLAPQQTYLLRAGDEIRLGGLELNIYFIEPPGTRPLIALA